MCEHFCQGYLNTSLGAPTKNLPMRFIAFHEALVGAYGQKYSLVAFGEAAAHAETELAKFQKMVVRLCHVNFC